MAEHDNSIEPTPPSRRWPNEPEGMLELLPDNLEGSPFDMLLCTLMRTHGIIAVLSSEFMSDGNTRPTDTHIMSALWAAQGHLRLARELLECLEVPA
jgi:hypothetical protein